MCCVCLCPSLYIHTYTLHTHTHTCHLSSVITTLFHVSSSVWHFENPLMLGVMHTYIHTYISRFKTLGMLRMCTSLVSRLYILLSSSMRPLSHSQHAFMLSARRCIVFIENLIAYLTNFSDTVICKDVIVVIWISILCLYNLPKNSIVMNTSYTVLILTSFAHVVPPIIDFSLPSQLICWYSYICTKCYCLFAQVLRLNNTHHLLWNGSLYLSLAHVYSFVIYAYAWSCRATLHVVVTSYP